MRIGLMVDSFVEDAWIGKIIADIRDSGFADIVLVVENIPIPSRKPSRRERLRRYWRQGLYNLYVRFDHSRYRPRHDAFAQVDLSPLLEGVARIRVEPLRKGFTDRFREEDLEVIKAAKLDVLFRFGFRIIRGPVLNTARAGVWSFHHDDNLEYRGSPPSFWEIYERNPVSGSILQVLTDSLDGGRVLYRSHSATCLNSLQANRNPLYWKTAEFALRRLRQLDQHGMGFLEALPTWNENVPYTRGIYRAPKFGQMLYFIGGQIHRRVRSNLNRAISGNSPQWFVALRPRALASFAETTGYRVIVPPRDRFYADPFLVDRDGKSFLFYENYSFAKERAHISCSEVRPDASITEPVTVLECPYHLSYPFIFDHDGETYMIPESAANRTVDIYRAEQFPTKWTYHGILLADVNAVDATIHAAGGKLWMFVGVAASHYPDCDELCLYHADNVLGPWTPHPLNPIISDVRRARPAGKLFFEDGKLIRPSQDCSQAYGYALNFSEVVRLNETEYEERPIAKILPTWHKGNLGTHHFTRSNSFEAIDGNIRVKTLSR